MNAGKVECEVTVYDLGTFWKSRQKVGFYEMCRVKRNAYLVFT